MKKYAAYLVNKLSVFIILLLLTSISFAAADNFTPYVNTSVSYDSNVYRVANDAEAISVLGSTKTDDTVRYLGAGFRAELPVSRQQLLIDASVKKANHDNFSVLDHTQTEGKATWRWQVGNLWSGNLGTRYSESLSTFYELQSVLKEIRTQNVSFLDGGYQIHPDWRLVAGVRRSNIRYREEKELDRDVRSEQLEIQYRNTLNTRVGLRTKVTEVDLLNLEDVGGTLVSNDSKETEISGAFYWEGTNKSHFEARLGVTDRKYDELKERDFRGSIGRLTYRWFMTRITKLDIALWQEESEYNDETTTFVVTKGVSIRPTWSATRKITVNGEISYRHDDFEGESAVIIGSGQAQREDDIRLLRINASYAHTRNVSWSIAYQTEKRTSNRADSEFDYRQIDAKVQLSF